MFLNFFFPKTYLVKKGVRGEGHPIRNPLIFGSLVKDDIMQFFARSGILHSVQWFACLCVTPGEQVTTEVLDGPQEELVTELRARIKDLQQHQERLLREGETLQVSPVWQISWKYNDWVINYEVCSKIRVNCKLCFNRPLYSSVGDGIVEGITCKRWRKSESDSLTRWAEV